MYLFNETFKNPRWKNKLMNDSILFDIFLRLEEVFINSFEWVNLPSTIDERFLELCLCERGHILYFNDEIIGDIALPATLFGPYDIYNIPTFRRAFAVNGYQAERNGMNSVIIYNNFLHQPALYTIMLYATRIYEIERTINVNVKAQKTPVVVLCSEENLLTYKNAFKDIEGDMPVLFATKNLDLQCIKALNTEAKYVAQDLNTLKKQYWNEFFSFCGIMNTSSEKKERQVADEVSMSMGGIIAQRQVMLNARKEACKKINNMFGTDIDVKFRYPDLTDTERGEVIGNLYNNSRGIDRESIPD